MNEKQRETLIECLNVIREVIEDEEEKLDNMSEKFSETERYQVMEETVERLREVEVELEEIVMG